MPESEASSWMPASEAPSNETSNPAEKSISNENGENMEQRVVADPAVHGEAGR